ncbi:MAG: DUF3459 domain-containing protein, partial [Pseudohongiellaceae bacterium]
YLGDELGLLNDYSYQQDVNKLNDSRWVNRVAVNDADLDLRNQPDTPNGQIYADLRRLIELRKTTPLLGDAHTHIIETGNPHIFGFTRTRDAETLLVLANFADFEQHLDASLIDSLLTGGKQADLLDSEAEVALQTLQPHQVRWLTVQ